jgi:hypothetical protein
MQHRSRLGRPLRLAIPLLVFSAGCSTPRLGTPGAPGAFVDGTGHWSVTLGSPAWTFGGALGVGAADLTSSSGRDAIGAYHETGFAFRDGAARKGAIRVYDQAPIVMFRQQILADTANRNPFPTIATLPNTAHHLSYIDQQFSPYSFSSFGPDSPWIFFDDTGHTFILSAATHFMNAAIAQDDATSPIRCGIDSDVTMLPAGFESDTLLVVEPGINRAFETWGGALLALGGKTRPANDASPELNQLGYWTDNGASYYYNFDQQRGYTGTLLAVRDEFQQKGIPLGYMQLDSWWYPKGSPDGWSDRSSGEYLLNADSTLFPDGLAAFQEQLRIPLVTHARWIDPKSPYRAKYTMSNNVSTDLRFWNDIGAYLKSNGVSIYEQDWLDLLALPATTNLADQDAFMDHMAAGMKAAGLNVQYCMPMPRHFLQSTRYANLTTTRVNYDHFMPARYPSFFYASRLASAVGAWPWTDVFMSTEENNLILSTLTGGMVGVGDALGTESAANLARVVRSDGVIVKPDAPIVLVDRAVLDEARGVDAPAVGATFSDHGGGQRMSYVFAYAKDGAKNLTASFTPAELGYSGRVYVYSFSTGSTGSGQLVDAGGSFSAPLQNGFGYWIVTPLGTSGLGFLGDAGKYVAAGKKRVAGWRDDGTLAIDLVFAAGEGAVTLHGYAPAAPHATASAGTVGAVSWDAATQLFSVDVTPAAGAASLTLTP